MSLRHLSRQIVIQALFAWDFYKQDPEYAQKAFDWTVERHNTKMPNADFAIALYNGTIKKSSVIDEIITKAAPAWPIEKIAPVDRNILRLGIFELLFSDNKDVPPRVAINEGIELAKTFGGPNSYKFVSGVLGSIYEVSDLKAKDKGKGKKEEEAARHEEKVGAFVYCETDEGDLNILFIHNVFNHWTLPKGGIKGETDPEQGILEVLRAKVSIEGTVEHTLGTNTYKSRDPEHGLVEKKITYFVVKATNPDSLSLDESIDGLDKAEFMPIETVATLKTYKDMAPIIEQGMKLITQ